MSDNTSGRIGPVNAPLSTGRTSAPASQPSPSPTSTAPAVVAVANTQPAVATPVSFSAVDLDLITRGVRQVFGGEALGEQEAVIDLLLELYQGQKETVLSAEAWQEIRNNPVVWSAIKALISLRAKFEFVDFSDADACLAILGGEGAREVVVDQDLVGEIFSDYSALFTDGIRQQEILAILAWTAERNFGIGGVEAEVLEVLEQALNEKREFTVADLLENAALWQAVKLCLFLGARKLGFDPETLPLALPLDDKAASLQLIIKLRGIFGLQESAALTRDLLENLVAETLSAARGQMDSDLRDLSGERILLAASSAEQSIGLLQIDGELFTIQNDPIFNNLAAIARSLDSRAEQEQGEAEFLTVSAETWTQREGEFALKWKALKLYLFLFKKAGLISEDEYLKVLSDAEPAAAIEMINRIRRDARLAIADYDTALIDARMLRAVLIRCGGDFAEGIIAASISECFGEADQALQDLAIKQVNRQLALVPGETLSVFRIRQILLEYGRLIRDGYVEGLTRELESFKELLAGRADKLAELKTAFDSIQRLLAEVRAASPRGIENLSEGELLALLLTDDGRREILPHNSQAREVIEQYLTATQAYYGPIFSDAEIFEALFLSEDFAGSFLETETQISDSRRAVLDLMAEIENREDNLKQIDQLLSRTDLTEEERTRFTEFKKVLEEGGEFNGQTFEGRLADLKAQLPELKARYIAGVLELAGPADQTELKQYLEVRRLEAALQFYRKMTVGFDEWIKKIEEICGTEAGEGERLGWAERIITVTLPNLTSRELQALTEREITGEKREYVSVEDRRLAEDVRALLNKILDPNSGLSYVAAREGVYRARIVEERPDLLTRRLAGNVGLVDYRDVSHDPAIYLLGAYLRAGLAYEIASPLSGEWVARYLTRELGGILGQGNFRSVISTSIINSQTLAGRLEPNDQVLDILIRGLDITREQAFEALNRLSRGDETILLVFKKEGTRYSDLSFAQVDGEGAHEVEDWLPGLIRNMVIYYYSLYVDQPSANVETPQVLINMLLQAQNFYFSRTGGEGGVSAIGFAVLRDLMGSSEFSGLTSEEAAPILEQAFGQAQQVISEMARQGSFSALAEAEQLGAIDRLLDRILSDRESQVEQAATQVDQQEDEELKGLEKQLRDAMAGLDRLEAQVGDSEAGMQYVELQRQTLRSEVARIRRQIEEHAATNRAAIETERQAAEEDRAGQEKVKALVKVLVGGFARALSLRATSEISPLVVESYFGAAQSLILRYYPAFSNEEAELLSPEGADILSAAMLAMDGGLVTAFYEALTAQRAVLSPAETSAPHMDESAIYEMWRDWIVVNTDSQGEDPQYEWITYRPGATVKLLIYRAMHGPNPIRVENGQAVFDPTIRSTDIRYLAQYIRETREFGLPEIEGEQLDIEDAALLLEKAADIIASGRFTIEDSYIRHPQIISEGETAFSAEERKALNFALEVTYSLYGKVVGLAFPSNPEMRDSRAAQRGADEGWGWIPDFWDHMGYTAFAATILPSPAVARDPEMVDRDKILMLKEKFRLLPETPDPYDPEGTRLDKRFIEAFIQNYGGLLEQSKVHWMTGRQPEEALYALELEARENPIAFLEEFLREDYSQPFTLAQMIGDSPRLSIVKRMLQKAISLWNASNDFPILGIDIGTPLLSADDDVNREIQMALDTVAGYIRGMGSRAEGHLYGLRLKGFLTRQGILNPLRDNVSLLDNQVNASVARMAGRRFRALLDMEGTTPEKRANLINYFKAAGLEDITWEDLMVYVERLESAQGDWTLDFVYGEQPDGLEEIADALQVFVRAVIPRLDPLGEGEQPAYIVDSETAYAAAAAAREGEAAPQSLGDISFDDPVGELSEHSPFQMESLVEGENAGSHLLRLTLKFIEFKFLMMPTIQLGMQLGFLYQMLSTSGPFAAYDRRQTMYLTLEQGANFLAFRFNAYALIKSGIIALEQDNISEAVVNFIFGFQALNSVIQIARNLYGRGQALLTGDTTMREFRERLTAELESMTMAEGEGPRRSLVKRILAEVWMAPRRGASFVIEPITEVTRVLNRILGGSIDEYISPRVATSGGRTALRGRRALIGRITEMSENPNRLFTFRTQAPGIAPGGAELNISFRGGDYVPYLRRSVDPFKLDGSILMVSHSLGVRNNRYLESLMEAMIRQNSDPAVLFADWTPEQIEQYLRREAARRLGCQNYEEAVSRYGQAQVNQMIEQLPRMLAQEAVQAHLQAVQAEISRMGFFGGFFGRSRMERFLIWADRRRAVREFAEGRPDRPTVERPEYQFQPGPDMQTETIPTLNPQDNPGVWINFSEIEVQATAEAERLAVELGLDQGSAGRRVIRTLLDRVNMAAFDAEFNAGISADLNKAVEELKAQGIDPQSEEGFRLLEETMKRAAAARQAEIALRVAREVAGVMVLEKHGLSLEPSREDVRARVKDAARQYVEEAGITRGRRVVKAVLGVFDGNYETLYRSRRLALMAELLGGELDPAKLEALLSEPGSEALIRQKIDEFEGRIYREIAQNLARRATYQRTLRQVQVGDTRIFDEFSTRNLSLDQLRELNSSLRHAGVRALIYMDGLIVGVNGMGNARVLVELDGSSHGFRIVEPEQGQSFGWEEIETRAVEAVNRNAVNALQLDFPGMGIEIGDGARLTELDVEKIRIALEKTAGARTVTVDRNGFEVRGANGAVLRRIEFTQNGGLPPEMIGAIALHNPFALRAMAEADLKAFYPDMFEGTSRGVRNYDAFEMTFRSAAAAGGAQLPESVRPEKAGDSIRFVERSSGSVLAEFKLNAQGQVERIAGQGEAVADLQRSLETAYQELQKNAARELENLVLRQLSGSRGLARAKRLVEAAARRAGTTILQSASLITMLEIDEVLRILDVDMPPAVQFFLVVGGGEAVGRIMQRVLNPTQVVSLSQHLNLATQGLSFFSLGVTAWRTGLNLLGVSPTLGLSERWGSFVELGIGTVTASALSRMFYVRNAAGAMELTSAGRAFARIGGYTLAAQLAGATAYYIWDHIDPGVGEAYGYGQQALSVVHPTLYGVLSSVIGDAFAQPLIALFDPGFINDYEAQLASLSMETEDLAGGVKDTLLILLFNFYMAQQSPEDQQSLPLGSGAMLDQNTLEGFTSWLKDMFTRPAHPANVSQDRQVNDFILDALENGIPGTINPVSGAGLRRPDSIFDQGLYYAIKAKFPKLTEEELKDTLEEVMVEILQKHIGHICEIYQAQGISGSSISDIVPYFNEQGLLQDTVDDEILGQFIATLFRDPDHQAELEAVNRMREAQAVRLLILYQFKERFTDGVPVTDELLARYSDMSWSEIPAYQDALNLMKEVNREFIVRETERLLRIMVANNGILPESEVNFLDRDLGLVVAGPSGLVIDKTVGREPGEWGVPTYYEAAAANLRNDRELMDLRAGQLASHADANGFIPDNSLEYVVFDLDVDLGLVTSTEDGYQLNVGSGSADAPRSMEEQLEMAADTALLADPEELNQYFSDYLQIAEYEENYNEVRETLRILWSADLGGRLQKIFDTGLYRLLYVLYSNDTPDSSLVMPVDVIADKLAVLQDNNDLGFVERVKRLLPQFEEIRAALKQNPSDPAALLALNALCLRAAGGVSRSADISEEERQQMVWRMTFVIFRDHPEQSDLLAAAAAREVLVSLGDDMQWEQDEEYLHKLLELAEEYHTEINLDNLGGNLDELAMQLLREDILKEAVRINP